jgi:hypothetical protein
VFLDGNKISLRITGQRDGLHKRKGVSRIEQFGGIRPYAVFSSIPQLSGSILPPLPPRFSSSIHFDLDPESFVKSTKKYYLLIPWSRVLLEKLTSELCS